MLARGERGLELGGVPLRDVIEAAGSPAYVYDLDAMAREASALAAGFGATKHLIAYAIKANSAGPIVRAITRTGAGAEVVSGAELAVAMGCGVDPERISMSGVGKTDAEIDRAIGAGSKGIRLLQMESVEEIARVEARAKAAGRRARVSLRVNPGVIADTHAHVATGHDEAKFGIAREDLGAAWEALDRSPHLVLVGLGAHVGSQLTETGDYLASAKVVLAMATAWEARGAGAPRLELIDFGGGFGVDYGGGCEKSPRDFAAEASALLASSPFADRTLLVEPGRSLVAPFGVLVSRVITVKSSHVHGGRRWLVIDAGMNDLIRPALYAAKHRIEDMGAARAPAEGSLRYRVVGPVCESSDDFGEHAFAEVPSRVVIRDAGAYGYTMASEYNGRGLPAEVFLEGGQIRSVFRPRSGDAWAEERVRM